MFKVVTIRSGEEGGPLHDVAVTLRVQPLSGCDTRVDQALRTYLTELLTCGLQAFRGIPGEGVERVIHQRDLRRPGSPPPAGEGRGG